MTRLRCCSMPSHPTPRSTLRSSSAPATPSTVEIDRVVGDVISRQAFDSPPVDLTAPEGRLIALFALDIVLAQASRDLVPPGAVGLLPSVHQRAIRTGRLDSGLIPGAVLPRHAVTAPSWAAGVLDGRLDVVRACF